MRTWWWSTANLTFEIHLLSSNFSLLAPGTLHLGSKNADPKWKPDAVAFAHPSLTQDSDL